MIDLTCPQCGAENSIEEDIRRFCGNCDFPLFWADPPEAAPTPLQEELNDEDEQEQGQEEDDIDAQVDDVICRNCALRNPGDRTYCQRCGEELPAPEEWFDPNSPVEVIQDEPDRSIWSHLALPVLATLVIGVGVAAALIWWLDVFSDPGPVVVRVLDQSGDTGYDTAIVFGGTQASPFIVYREAAEKAVRVMRCTSSDCGSRISPAISVDEEGDPGHGLAVDLMDGPVIVYRVSATGSLVEARCATFLCADELGTRGFHPIDESDDVGYEPAIAVGGSVAFLTYRDAGNGSLKAALLCRSECGDGDGEVVAAMSRRGRIINVLAGSEEGSDTGYDSAVAIPSAASPFVAYRDAANPSLLLIRCLTQACSQASAPVELASGDVGHDAAMVIDPETKAPVIAHRDNTSGDLVVVFCGDEECTENRAPPTVVDRGGDQNHSVGHSIVMGRGIADMPVIAYRDDTAGVLKMALCGDAACTDDNRVIAVIDDGGAGDSPAAVGFDIAMTIHDGTAYLAYRDDTNKSLKFAAVDLERLKAEATEPGGQQGLSAWIRGGR
ncbi:MAG: hypothetical protein WD208_00410 [Dehalococcoidia bacterium]